MKTMTFNSVGCLCFSLNHKHEDTTTITPYEIRKAIAERLLSISDDELNEAVEFEDTIQGDYQND